MKVETVVFITICDGIYKMGVTATGLNGSVEKVFEFAEFPMEYDQYIQETVAEYEKLGVAL